MRVMVCIPHYYPVSGERHAVQGSSQDAREQRASSVQYCLTALQSILSREHFLIGTRTPGIGIVVNNDVTRAKNNVQGDIFLCTQGDNHILDLLQVRGFNRVQSGNANAMMLGYTCRRVFAELQDQYDIFVYIEDDIAPLDSAFFRKIKAFYDLFGEKKIVLPQRFENFRTFGNKVYTDQPTPPAYQIAPEFSAEPRLSMPTFDGEAYFDWSMNHGAGCYAITRAQLKAWSKLDDFHRPDPSIHMDYLEQAMLPLRGRYPMYKAAVENIDFLEVHHVPNRLCHAAAPFYQIRAMLTGAPPP